MLQSMGSQRVRPNWLTEEQQKVYNILCSIKVSGMKFKLCYLNLLCGWDQFFSKYWYCRAPDNICISFLLLPKQSISKFMDLHRCTVFLSPTMVLKWVKVTQSCPTLYNCMDHTVYGILQARILKWVTFPFSRGSSQPRDQTQVSRIAGRFFTSWATREAPQWS